MSLFDTGGSLEQVLGQQAENQVNSIGQQYAKKRRASIAQQAHAGRLGSGVANYTAGDIDSAEAGDVGDVYGNLAQSLGQVPINEYTSSRDADRKRQLAELIGKLNKPSSLEEALGALGQFGGLASTAASFF
jgi:hypothetical protein